MVFCTYCGQSFTRDEHLERHILTHTNVKPFKCCTCHMSFARRDLLQRHYTVHGRDENNREGLPANIGMNPKSAGRTPIACSNCAKTKTKCDKKFPCSRCASRNLQCTLRPTRRAQKAVPGRPAPPIENPISSASSEKGSSEVTTNNSSCSSGSCSPPLQARPGQSIQGESQTQTRFKDDDGTENTPSPGGEALMSSSPRRYDGTSPGAAETRLSMSVSSVASPMGQFVHTTPLSGYDEFIQPREGADQTNSPSLFLDWTHLHLAPHTFDTTGRSDIIMNADMGFDMCSVQTPAEALATIVPDMSASISSIHTPIATPRLDGGLSDLELGSSAALFYPPTRNTSLSQLPPEVGAIVAAQDGWTVFRCTPSIPSHTCPRTARLNLERLEQSLRDHECWGTWKATHSEDDFATEYSLAVRGLHESTRDKLLAITQAFLHKALDIHREGSVGSPTDGVSSVSSGSNFILLPPAKILEHFLSTYATSFEPFFPLTAKGSLDANEIMRCSNEKAASLLILLMIAQGAIATPSPEARWLTGGLTEACRISLFDLIEKNIVMSGDAIVLRAALLFTVQAAWSGDKWQMDIAMGQRGMYLAMLRHSGIVQNNDNGMATSDRHQSSEDLWKSWILGESCSRLVYSWAMVDQDLSLFHDTVPLFSVTEFGVPMPDSESLWQAVSATEWSELFDRVHKFSGGFSSVGSGARPLPLRTLFRHFLDDEIEHQCIELTPFHLRLLLHPLQSLVCQYRQLLSCFSDDLATPQHHRAVTAASTRTRLEEVQALLQRWLALAERYLKNHEACPMMKSNLVLFHLISLNAVSDFPEIERFARREDFDGSYQQMIWFQQRSVSNPEEAVVHCGQTIRLIRSMSRGIRPPWWAGAVYRAGLILWSISLGRSEQYPLDTSGYLISGPSFAIDALLPDHPLIIRYLTKKEGLPTLTKADGSQVALDHSLTILSYCIDMISEGHSTRLSDGIKNKLERLSRF